MLDEFRRIAETAVPHPIQSRLVTPDEARAVISSFNRLSDPMRSNFLGLPVENIIEFSMMQTKKRPSLYNYMNGVKESVAESLPDAPQAIPEDERDHLDQEPMPIPIQETVTVAPEKPTRPKKRAIPEAKPEPRAEEQFFTRLIERLERLATAPATGTVEAQQALLGGLTALTERVEKIAANAVDRGSLTEMVAIQKDMAVTLSESQTQIMAVQKKLIDTQGLIVESLNAVAVKLAEYTQTPPVINLPAPIINLTTQEGRRIKVIERDHNNLLSKVIESYEEVS